MSNSTGNSQIFKTANNVHGTFPGVTRTALVPSLPNVAHHLPEALTEPIEWAKFCMWLRGYLRAVEGRELTAKDSATIMEKLATVDPDSRLIKVYDNPPIGTGTLTGTRAPIVPGTGALQYPFTTTVYSTTSDTGANANQNNSTGRCDVDGDL